MSTFDNFRIRNVRHSKILLFEILILIHFSELLLCKINVLDIFDTGDFFQILIISRSTWILIESNFWLGMYVSYILNVTW